MIYNEHLIELYIDDTLADITSQESLNLRLNSVLYNPTEIISREAEYSFSFDLPATNTNNKIFGYANNLSVLNKFTRNYKAKVYADGHLLFDGTIIVNSIENHSYNVNLVAVKAVDFEEIFGDSTMNEIDWWIDFNGVNSINDYNASSNDVTFPLISYGAFQKVPVSSDEVGNEYTSKFDLDKYNRWYVESFYPSPNMLKLLSEVFDVKGYRLEGDIFSDEMMRNIYLSINLSDEQDPTYNLGHPNFGKVKMSVTASTSGQQAYEQELAFPYFEVWNPRGQFGGQYGSTATVQAWNWNTIKLYDLLSIGTVQMKQPICYMYQPNEHIIVIPANGFYRFDLDIKSVTQANTNLTVGQSMLNSSGNDIEVNDVSISSDLREQTPFEIHIVRNYDDDIELIKGKHNKKYTNGDPTRTTYNGKSNVTEWDTAYPHEDPYNSVLPTEKNNLTFRNTMGRFRGSSVQGENYNVAGGSRNGGGNTGFGGRTGGGTTTPRTYSSTVYGYMPQNMGELMMYDPAVSPNFICGASTFMGGTPSVMKNGKSWSASNSDIMRDFYTETGYIRLYNESGTTRWQKTQFNQNEYPDSPANTFISTKNSANGKVSCMIYLNKNDIIQVFGIQRAYETAQGADVNYSTSIQFDLDINAASPKTYEQLKLANFGHNSTSDFDYDLRMGNFMNSSTTMSEWVTGIVNAFNLEVKQDGYTITMNKKKKFANNDAGYINLDNRVNSADAVVRPVEYPSSMSVRYKIDTDEYGFEKSVPSEYLNLENWAEYGDSGYSIIKLSDKEGANEATLEIPFSYCWYIPFHWYNVDSADTQTGDAYSLWTAVLSKSQYMIDGYDYSDSLKHDGYGLAQRMWFRPTNTNRFVWTDTYPQQRVNIYVPDNVYNDFNLSYKTEEKSLLDYFNITPFISSNYVNVDAYLSADEYKFLKNGGNIRFDSDIYYPVSLSGFDPTGVNETDIKMIKKVN